MRFVKIYLGVVLLGLTFSVTANPGSWMPTAKKISEIIVEGGDGGQAAIVIEGGVPATHLPEECRDGGNGTYNTIYLNTDKGKSIYSLALAAYLAGKPVKLALACTGSRPLITHVRF